MATYTQAQRLLSVSTSLGTDVLLLKSFTGREEMSRLFHYQLELASENDAVAPTDVVGKTITWVVQYVDTAPRYFNGYVSRFAAGGKVARGLRSYRAEVVPWPWFLTRTANCMIFQNKSADAIIKAVFDSFGFSDYKFSLTRTPATRDYCVQYRETAFNFVSRLMEEEGIFYFFAHENGKHTMTLADAASAFADCQEGAVEYSGGSLSPNHISTWEHAYEYRPGKWTQTDYNFETPSTSLLTTEPTVLSLANISSYEMFDYPGLYPKTSGGSPLTKIRMQEEETPYNVVAGTSSCCTFTPGGKFSLTQHELSAEEGKYVLTGVQHHATDPSYGDKGQGASYSNSFTCIPASVAFRPARATPKPFVQGPQTAVVVGKSGEEIYVDKYGRVKVQFFWDRIGTKDENSSCWVRVSQGWAGKNMGMLFTPRIGQEVIVDFLEGDPDRPLITGRVYNAENMPIWTLPDNQTRSGIRTLSTKGGTRGNTNILGFDDNAGKEMIFIHAEKDYTREVENNDSLKVGSSDTKYCADGSQTIEIWKNRTETVHKGNETITIETGDRTLTVQTGKDTTTVKSDYQLEIQKGKCTVLVDTGDDLHQVKTGNRDVKVDTGNDTLTIQTGNHKVAVSAGKSETTAAQSITLTCGPASIKLEPTAITLAIGPSTIKLEMAKITLDGLAISAGGQLQSEWKAGLQGSFGSAVMNKLGGGAAVMIG